VKMWLKSTAEIFAGIKELNMYRQLLIMSPTWSRVKVVKALFLVFALAVSCGNLLAEDWTTSDGTLYQNVRVVRVEDDAVTILYKDGGALVFLNKLSPSLQERFYYYPVKAKAAAQARAKADVENAKELQAEIEESDRLKRAQQIKDAQAQASTPAAK
jgi:hypothetical protein